MNDLTKPWRGIQRELIQWYPQIEEEICIGCGMYVTGCGRMVLKFDFKKKMPVVANPLNCMVACVTCANACPLHAISFPPLSYVHKLIKENDLIKKSREELNNNREKYKKNRRILWKTNRYFLTHLSFMDIGVGLAWRACA